MKHVWQKIEGNVVHPSLPEYRRWTTFHSCDRCGYLKEMKYVLPEETLRAIGVPDCDDHLIRSIMEG